MRAVISIHDVMPETLHQVRTVLGELPEVCHKNLTMLVVPGRKWSATDIEQLRYWQARGYTLAGHGWHHEVQNISSLYHRIHSRLISRNVAEHLSLKPEELATLLQNNHKWFWDNDLDSPDFYVPPAWAMGRLGAEEMSASPFRYFENMGGIFDAKDRRFVSLPLAGFEADTPIRSRCLTVWNYCNYRFASKARPLRIAIHPNDFALRQAGQLKRMLGKVTDPVIYRDLFPQTLQESRAGA